jgi:hypothetical protein
MGGLLMFDGRRSVTLILAVASAVGLTAVAGSGGAIAGTRMALRAAAMIGTWRSAREIPGTAALNQGGYAEVKSVSCSSPGNCSAGGWYTDGFGGTQAFIVSEIKGAWHTAIEVPGTAALNKAFAQLNAVSCASAGNCSAGCFYENNNGYQAFVVSEVNGVWHRAIEVPGSAALNLGGYAGVNSVSCGTPGNCTAGGYYLGNSTSYQPFVVSEVNGTWHHAIRVPGILSRPANGHAGPTAEVSSVSCASAGNCSIGGSYYDSSNIQAFVGSEVNGIWRKAVKIPGTAALNKGDALVSSVSCGSAGNCGAGGWYTDSAGYERLMVVNEVNGAWHNAIEVPGTAVLNKGDGQVTSVSCASGRNCSAGGWYMDSSSLANPLVVSEVNGTWHNAIRVPGMTALTRHIFGAVTSVSCASAGNCSAGGWYTDSSDRLVQPFVVSEVNGTWHNAANVPGITTLNQGGTAWISSVACGSAGNCSAGGSYTDSFKHYQVFVVNKA